MEMTATVEQVPARLWRNWVDGNRATIIDVREPGEFAMGSLPDAGLVPLATLPAQMADLDREVPLLVICRSGSRSDLAAALLARAGFRRVANMAGGLTQLGLA